MIASYEEEKFNVDEKLFRYHVAVDPMANELLNNGIKRFADDIEKLEHIVRSRLEWTYYNIYSINKPNVKGSSIVSSEQNR